MRERYRAIEANRIVDNYLSKMANSLIVVWLCCFGTRATLYSCIALVLADRYSLTWIPATGFRRRPDSDDLLGLYSRRASREPHGMGVRADYAHHPAVSRIGRGYMPSCPCTVNILQSRACHSVITLVTSCKKKENGVKGEWFCGRTPSRFQREFRFLSPLICQLGARPSVRVNFLKT